MKGRPFLEKSERFGLLLWAEWIKVLGVRGTLLPT